MHLCDITLDTIETLSELLDLSPSVVAFAFLRAAEERVKV
jgi:hypothetical protein